MKKVYIRPARELKSGLIASCFASIYTLKSIAFAWLNSELESGLKNFDFHPIRRKKSSQGNQRIESDLHFLQIVNPLSRSIILI